MMFLIKRIRYYFAIVLISLLSAACEQPAPLVITTEQSVYETFFVERIGDLHSKYYLAGATENDWFKENPFDQYSWDNELEKLGGVSISLVKELYRLNEESHALNWKPIVTNAELLPDHYARKAEGKEKEDRCFVEGSKGNIGVYREGKGRYRSYYTVSKVAFSEDKTIAMLKISYLCAPLSGAGEFFITFELKDNRWHPLGGRLLWIS